MKKMGALLLVVMLMLMLLVGCGDSMETLTTTMNTDTTSTTTIKATSSTITNAEVSASTGELLTQTTKLTTAKESLTATTKPVTTTKEKPTAMTKPVTTTKEKPTATTKPVTTTKEKPTATTKPVTTTKEKPTTTATSVETTIPKPVSGSLTVLDEPFDTILVSDNSDIIAGERNGKWGAIKSDGSIHIPFEYDGIQIQTDGYIIMRKVTPTSVVLWDEKQDKIDSYLFDASGKMALHTTLQPFIITDELGYKGEYIYSYRAGVVLTYQNDIVEGLGDEVTLYLRKPDGTLIKSIESVVSFVPMDNGHTVISYPVSDDSRGNSVAIIDQTGNIIRKQEGGFRFSDMLFAVDVEGVSGGYLCLNFAPSTSWVLVDVNNFDKRYYFNRDSDDDWFTITDYYGTFIVAESDNGGYGLFDLSKITTATATKPDDYVQLQVSESGCITNKLYDHLAIRSYFGEKADYALIQEGNKWGYLSLDGAIKKMFDDASAFTNGYAMVKMKDTCYVIDKDFKKISVELTGYDSVGTLGKNLFAVKKNGKYYPVIYTP